LIFAIAESGDTDISFTSVSLTLHTSAIDLENVNAAEESKMYDLYEQLLTT